MGAKAAAHSPAAISLQERIVNPFLLIVAGAKKPQQLMRLQSVCHDFYLYGS
jgi:hypothetical protein